ncbi:MAG: hypothetical protein K9M57_02925, partial [Phycisphaerae bacterium]|nr:hypothetical protein [Phycisphaerae bacterium]
MNQSSPKYAEECWANVTTRYRLTNALHDSKTPFQNMEIVESAHYGRMLLLDGMVQTTEKDEFVY